MLFIRDYMKYKNIGRFKIKKWVKMYLINISKGKYRVVILIFYIMLIFKEFYNLYEREKIKEQFRYF